jgi:predicted TIM-barrel fold metal-dependent hydrolase
VVPDAWRMAVDELGEDHLLMATDYPHFDSEYAHIVAKLKANKPLTPSQNEKALGENAQALPKI